MDACRCRVPDTRRARGCVPRLSGQKDCLAVYHAGTNLPSEFVSSRRDIETEAGCYCRSPLADLLAFTCAKTICNSTIGTVGWVRTKDCVQRPIARIIPAHKKRRVVKIWPIIADAGNRSINSILDQLGIHYCGSANIVASELRTLLRINRTCENQCMDER